MSYFNDLCFEGDEPFRPSFLDTDEKWNFVVQETNTPEKFKELVYRILNEESVTHIDWYKLVKRLQLDILERHGDPTICFLLDILESLLKNFAQIIHNFSLLNLDDEEEVHPLLANNESDLVE